MAQGITPRRADYGIDAPTVVRNLLIAGGLCVALALGWLIGLYPVDFGTGIPFASMALWAGIPLLLTGLAMIYGSKVGKLRMRERLLDTIPWRGDELVLDVGCGRGLLLVAAARRLKTGKVIGVDIWQKSDLAGNRLEATLANAAAEGVADRVTVQDGDARKLPFADAHFDVIVSSSALHNIYKTEERQQALREVARVLKPGGHVAIFDIRHTREYVQLLQASGLVDVNRSGPWFLFVIPAHIVTGVKRN